MNINGLKVDESAIGSGLYGMICNRGDKAIVAFGMVPLWALEILRPMLREKIISEGAKRYGLLAEEVHDCLDEKAIAETMQQIEHQVVLGIYKAASEAGAMIA